MKELHLTNAPRAVRTLCGVLKFADTSTRVGKKNTQRSAAKNVSNSLSSAGAGRATRTPGTQTTGRPPVAVN